MEEKTLTVTVRQYSLPLPEETLLFLRGIEEDYRMVKNRTYERYSGIRSVNRLVPVWDVLTEMRHCGLREQLGLPSVYYELAVTEAVSDIRSMWGTVKNKIRDNISANENLNDEDRHYIRTVLKTESLFADILNRRQHKLPNNLPGADIDTKRLDNLLRRLVRKTITMPRAERPGTFRVSPNGFRYKDGGIYLTGRTPKKRVFLPLKDGRAVKRQIQISVRENDAVLIVPVERSVKYHEDYVNTIYAHIGYRDMLTLSNGAVYGKALDELVTPETERLEEKNRNRKRMHEEYEKSLKAGDSKKAERIAGNNLGRKKYDAGKQREREKTKNFINAELNRMLETEKPAEIVITRAVTKKRTKRYAKTFNRKMARSFDGYIRGTLKRKCEANGITLTEINAKGTGVICSSCGAEGRKSKDGFVCGACGLVMDAAQNAAKNIERNAKTR